MKHLLAIGYRLIEDTPLDFKRYLYDLIDWNDRLIVIKGPKGVGKTTMLRQHIKEAFANDYTKAVFASLDHVWFNSHSILELAEYHYTHGGTHLFLDEIHKYKNWAQEIKNIYDYYPRMNIVATGSSILQIDSSLEVDLSRRPVLYDMYGLSFREYLIMEGITSKDPISLKEILERHVTLATRLTSEVKVLPLFESYLRQGYYPYYKESPGKYYEKLQNALVNVIESDLPLVGQLDYESVYKIKRLLAIMSETSPFLLNVSALAAILEVSRNTLVKLLDLLDRAKVIRKLYSSESGLSSLQKPEKILFGDTNVMYALGEETDTGTVRETFASNQLSQGHKLLMPKSGDLLVDEKVRLEIGGRRKSFKQIKDLPESYVIADGIEIGIGNKIPLWLLGFLY